MKKIFFIESFKNIKKNLITSTLLILCFIVLFCLFGEVTAQSFLSGKANESSEMASLVEYTQISLSPFTSASPKVQIAALYELSEEDIYAAGVAMDNIINGLCNDFGAYHNKMISGISGLKNKYIEEALYCSYDIYNINSSMMIIKDGVYFDRADFSLLETQNQIGSVCPVILGSEFAIKYDLSVGDVFVPDMFYTEDHLFSFTDDLSSEQRREWKVIGILEPDSSYMYRNVIDSLNHKLLIPDYILPPLDDFIEMNDGQINDEVLGFIQGELFTHFRNTDFYIKKDDMEEAIAFVNEQIASSSFLSQYYIAKESNDTLTMVAQNQEKASNFYNTIAIITYILSSFGIIMSVSNKIQNNKRNYAIHSLNGATVYDLIMCSVTEIMLLMLIADAFFFAFPYRIYYHRVTMGNNIYIARETPIFVLAVNIITLLVAVVVSSIVLHKFDTVAHLKKKE